MCGNQTISTHLFKCKNLELDKELVIGIFKRHDLSCSITVGLP